MKLLTSAVALLGLLASHGLAAASIDDDTKRQAAALRDQAMTDSIAYELIESLTMEVGPRPAGSAGDAAAVEWALQMLRGLGFRNVRTEAVEVPHWERGTLEARISSPFPQPLVATSLGGSPGTPATGIEAEVLRVESLDELRSLQRQDLEGKILFIDHRMQRHKSGKGYSPASRIRSCGHYLAAERGALATVIRSAGTSHHRVPHTGSMLNRLIPPTIPGVALANADADLLAYQLQSGEPVSLRLHSSARHLPRTMSANVIGEIPGKGSAADEIVLLAAHLDSWDLGTGAIDDAAGVAIVTTAAKLIMDSGAAPRRTIRVVLYANEEFGLGGAEQYKSKHAKTLKKHIVGMEADSGAGATWQLSSRVADSALPVVGEIQALLEAIGVERGNNLSTSGADLGPLRKTGMPILGFAQDDTHYFDFHHTPDDTLDKVDRADVNQTVAAFVTAAYVAANMRGDFGRIRPDWRPKRSCSAADDTWPSEIPPKP